jgi:hypothetical protein
MSLVQRCSMPDASLLQRHVGHGNFTDSYVTTIATAVSQEQFIAAFYTTRLFKLERWILKWTVSRPSSDAEAAELASGVGNAFAAWRVEARTSNQLLMSDLLGNTRSWLMTEPEGKSGTRLYFGSAVIAKADVRTGQRRLGITFRVLLGFHRLYSRALLNAAHTRCLQIAGETYR